MRVNRKRLNVMLYQIHVSAKAAKKAAMTGKNCTKVRKTKKLLSKRMYTRAFCTKLITTVHCVRCTTNAPLLKVKDTKMAGSRFRRKQS